MMQTYSRCPRCYGPFLGTFGYVSCLLCGWAGPTRRPTKADLREVLLDNRLDKTEEPAAKPKPKSSQYYGVCKFNLRWSAQSDVVGPNGQRAHKSFGTYVTELEAAQAVDRGLMKHGKEPRNFPKENYLTSELRPGTI